MKQSNKGHPCPLRHPRNIPNDDSRSSRRDSPNFCSHHIITFTSQNIRLASTESNFPPASAILLEKILDGDGETLCNLSTSFNLF